MIRTIPMKLFNLPNFLSVSRLLLAPLAWVLIVEGEWHLTAYLLIAAIISDIADGYLARRWHQTTALGGLLDHGSDAILVTTLLAAEATLGYIPYYLPPLVMLAFIQYTLDSRALAGQRLRASRLGRYNGILYFLLAALPIIAMVFPLELLEKHRIRYFAYGLMFSTLVSMVDRGIAFYRLPTQR